MSFFRVTPWWYLGKGGKKCLYCGYDKYRPDFLGTCVKCGGNLKTTEPPSYKLPRKWKRFSTLIVDLIIIGLLFEFIGGLIDGEIETGYLWFYFVFYLLYFTLLPYFTGKTVGQKLFDLKIVNEKTLGRPSVLRILERELLFITIGTGIGYIYYLVKGFYWDRWSGVTPIEID